MSFRFTIRDWLWLCVVLAVGLVVESRSYRYHDGMQAQINNLDAECDALRTCYGHVLKRVIDSDSDITGKSAEIQQIQNIVHYLAEKDRHSDDPSK